MLKNNDFEYEKEIGDDVNKIKNNEENILKIYLIINIK